MSKKIMRKPPYTHCWRAVMTLRNPQTGKAWIATSYHKTRELAERRVESVPPTLGAPNSMTCVRDNYSIEDTRVSAYAALALSNNQE
jgi:hypothetical protein